jgi:hypothetical protein
MAHRGEITRTLVGRVRTLHHDQRKGGNVDAGIRYVENEVFPMALLH